VDGDISILENELKFGVDIRDGQKTGFFLDQREMRSLVMSFARGRTVLNCFCYTGAFSVYALKGGALRVDSVDSSESALVSARENVKTNGFDALSNRFYVADVFEFLRGADEYDLIILDPPAFAKKRSDVSKAMRGYRDINRVAMQKISRPGTILTSSCSYYIEDELFRKLIFQAALEARREVRVLQKHRLAYDHRLCVFHPESDYLKSYLLSVD
jgi:23S rRNA (cytosine1962-C5)-methyltransferase